MLPHPFTATWRMLFRLRLTPSYDSCSSGECRKFSLCGRTRVLGIAGCVGGFGELGGGFCGLGARPARLLCAVDARGMLAPLLGAQCVPPPPAQTTSHRLRIPPNSSFLSPPLLFGVRLQCASTLCWVCAASPYRLGSRPGNKSPCRFWLTSGRHSPAHVSLAVKHRRDRRFNGKRSRLSSWWCAWLPCRGRLRLSQEQRPPCGTTLTHRSLPLACLQNAHSAFLRCTQHALGSKTNDLGSSRHICGFFLVKLAVTCQPLLPFVPLQGGDFAHYTLI